MRLSFFDILHIQYYNLQPFIITIWINKFRFHYFKTFPFPFYIHFNYLFLYCIYTTQFIIFLDSLSQKFFDVEVIFPCNFTLAMSFYKYAKIWKKFDLRRVPPSFSPFRSYLAIDIERQFYFKIRLNCNWPSFCNLSLSCKLNTCFYFAQWCFYLLFSINY